MNDSSRKYMNLTGRTGAHRQHARVDLARQVLAPAERAADAGEVDAALLLVRSRQASS